MSDDHWAELWISRFGPMWQAQCNFCREMSDPFDDEESRDEWVRRHSCEEKFSRLLPRDAVERGWRVVAPAERSEASTAP